MILNEFWKTKDIMIMFESTENLIKEVLQMSTKDFNLDLVSVSKTDAGASPRVTSVFMCTPGCVTGALMGCNLQTATCNCHVHISK